MEIICKLGYLLEREGNTNRIFESNGYEKCDTNEVKDCIELLQDWLGKVFHKNAGVN